MARPPVGRAASTIMHEIKQQWPLPRSAEPLSRAASVRRQPRWLGCQVGVSGSSGPAAQWEAGAPGRR